jgi:hypothetical protein
MRVPFGPGLPDRGRRWLTRRALLLRATSGLAVTALMGALTACRQGQAPAGSPTRTAPPSSPATVAPPRATRTAAPAAPAARTIVVLPTRGVGVSARQVRPGPVRRVFAAPYVFEPHIAVDPTNPDRLAAIVIGAPQLTFYAPANPVLRLATSTDGGGSWAEQQLEGEYDGVVGFDPAGGLYAVGLDYPGALVLFRAVTPGQPPSVETRVLVRTGVDKPWLGFHPRTGTIYIPYTAPTSGTTQGIVLQRSTDGGATWPDPVVVAPGVARAEQQAGRVAPPFEAQLLFGRDEEVAVVWASAPGLDVRPSDIWLATSRDGGRTFTPGRRIAASWGSISAAAHTGTYYLLHRRGTEQEQQLALAVSGDGGATWEATVVSGALPLAFDTHGTAPGLGIAPDGTLDIVFYGNDEPQAVDLAAWRNRRQGVWIDPHAYHVYYTCSRDGARTFTAPLRLNAAPIVGSRFVRTQGSSRRGEYIGMASTDAHACPIWIDTQGDEGTQVMMTRIER